MSFLVEIDFNPKNKKLAMKAPYMMADLCRSFPSRRFIPRTKVWEIPLTRANIEHLKSLKIDMTITEPAQLAIQNFEEIIKGPVYVPFPRHIYKFDLPPFQHQNAMMDLAWNLDAFAWFAEMGTGKTFTGIHLMFAAWQAGLIDAVSIIAPSTLRRTWQKELVKYAKDKSYDFRIHETKASWLKQFYERDEREEARTLKILAISVEGLGVSEQLYDSACGFYVGRRVFTLVDESSRIKNHKALRTQRVINLGAVSAKRGVLNGTPIALGIQDLWAQYEFLDPNIIGAGDYWAFKTRHIVMGGYENKQIVGVQNVDELMNRIRPYTIEVRKKDVLKDLPEKVMKVRYLEPTAEQQKLLKYIKTGKNPPPGIMIKMENTLERMLRGRQVVGGYLPLYEPDTEEVTIIPLLKNPKLEDLLDVVADNFANTKFIIWSTFVHEIEAIRDALADKYGERSVETYYGKTEMESRSAIEDRYCNDSSMRFFIGNPTAAGLGLTLISGENDLMYYYSGTNAFIDRAQSEDRAHRIGQKNSVVVIDPVMEGTVDVAIAESIRLKMDIDQYIKDELKKGRNLDDIMSGVLDTRAQV